jgi:hypothetical protein
MTHERQAGAFLAAQRGAREWGDASIGQLTCTPLPKLFTNDERPLPFSTRVEDAFVWPEGAGKNSSHPKRRFGGFQGKGGS